MSNQRQKRGTSLPTLSSQFQAQRDCPFDEIQAGEPTSSATLADGTPSSSESRAGSSRTLRSIQADSTVNWSVNQLPDQTKPSLKRPIGMFSGIERMDISGGNFIQSIIHRDDNTLKSLPCSFDAAFSAAINLDNLARRRCTDGTRVDIVAQIMAWVNEKDPRKAAPVYWLTGLAGLGKTTIAYTICELLDKASLPFASFFCSRQLDSRNSKLLVTTICRDLAEIYKPYAANVMSVMETNSKAVHAGLRIQIDQLLAQPWQAAIGQLADRDMTPPIVVVDALDESDRGTEFLEELLRVIDAGQLAGMKFLVTSRPDPKVVDICKPFPPNAICKLHEVDTGNVQNDIEKYLREALPELKDEPELRLLSQRAGGFFVYATTAVRFISPPHSPPAVSEMRSHLQTMLSPEQLTSHADSDERLLVDELYERILGEAFRDARVRASRLRILHTIVCAESGIDVSVLSDLTASPPDVVKRVVESLHAVLFVSPKDGRVYWYHASFPDFVFSDPTHHVVDVFCNAPAHHGDIARRCFLIMRESLRFNMCNLPSSYIFDSEVPGLDDSVDGTFTPTLQYVSVHWGRHLVRAVPAKSDNNDLLCSLKEFLCNRLLFWIEAMNLIGAKSDCSGTLKDAESWVGKGTEWPDLLREITDATNFSTFFAGSPASKSTPHLYVSALAMWRQESPIWKHWRPRFGFIPSISLPRGNITIPLLTIPMASGVPCIATSPNGDRIVSSSWNGFLQVWDAKTGKQLRELQCLGPAVTSAAFSPDGNRIVSGSHDNSVRVWDAKTGEQLRELQGHTTFVSSVAFSPDGDRIISGSQDKSVRVWDAKTGKELTNLQGHTDHVNSVAFLPDGNRIVSGSQDKSVRVWDAKTGKQLMKLQGHTHHVTSLAISSGGTRIISGSSDESVRVWDTMTGEQLTELHGHNSSVVSVAISPDDNRIVCGCFDKSVRIWDAKTEELLNELQGHTAPVSSVSFLCNDRIVSGSWDKSVRVWDANIEEQVRELQGHTATVSSVAFSPDGNQIVSGSHDKSVRIWDVKTGELLRELQGHTDHVVSVSFSADGKRIITGSWDRSVCVWDVKKAGQPRKLKGHTDAIISLAFSPVGIRISSSSDQSVRVWDANTGEQLRVHGHTDQADSVALLPDGDRVSVSYHQSVRVWYANTFKQLRELYDHLNSVTFLQDDHQVHSVSSDQQVWACDAKTGKRRGLHGCGISLAHSVAISPDGNQIVSGSWGGSMRLWNAKTGELLKELQRHSDSIFSVEFSSNGDRIVSGSCDKSVRVWDAKTGEQLRYLRGHTSAVFSVSFSADGLCIVSGSDDKSVRVWDAKTGKQLRKLQGHTDRVSSVSFSADGKRIVSGSHDKSVRVWDLTLDAPWIVDEDGWILTGAERLVWVPSTIRDVLLRPDNLLILSPNGTAKISFEQCELGTLWHKCYTP